MVEIIDAELEAARKNSPSYTDFLARLLRGPSGSISTKACAIPHPAGTHPGALDSGVVPVQESSRRFTPHIPELAELEFIPKAENIVLIGNTGVGKTGLTSGLLLKALQNGYRGLFIKAQDLFDDMYASIADRSSRKLVKRLGNVDVLLVDEMGYLNLRPEFFVSQNRPVQRRVAARVEPVLVVQQFHIDDAHRITQYR